MKNELMKYWKSSGLVKDSRLLKSFNEINRENFVLPEYKNQAYKQIQGQQH